MDDPDAPRRKKEKVEEPPPPPPPPTFSGEELESTRAKAYAEGEAAGQDAGYRRGRDEAKAEIEAALAHATQRLAASAERLLVDRDAVNADRTGQPLRIAMAVIDKLLPHLIQRHGSEELEEFISACLNEAIDEPRLIIRVNDGLLDALRPRVEEMAAMRGFDGRLVIQGDPATAAGDARIEWAEGGAERNTTQLLADITATATRMLGAEDGGASAPSDGHHG